MDSSTKQTSTSSPQLLPSHSSSQHTLTTSDMSTSTHEMEKSSIDNTKPSKEEDQMSNTVKGNTSDEKLDVEQSPPPPQTPKPPGLPPGVSPPPNGGLVAWMQVLAGFMLFFNTWGILNTFGIYQTYYETGQLFTETSSNISWIGSIQAYSVLLVGFLSGPIYDRGFLKPLLIIGSFGVVFGHMMLSLCHEYWQVLLSQGFCVGMGAGCLFVPAVALLPQYFSTKLGLAVGVAAAGSSMGGVIYPIVFYKLIDRIGFGWSTRVIGFIALGTLLLPIFVSKMRFQPPKARALVDFSAFTDWPYMLFTIGAMIGFIGLYVMLFYISYFAAEKHITDNALAFYIIPMLNAASVFGRTLPNALSDKTGPINIIIPGALINGVLILSLLAVHTAAGVIIIAILFGFFSGVFIALPPVAFVQFTENKRLIGTRIGMGFGIIGFGVLAGGPGGGGVLGDGSRKLDWTGLWIYGGVAQLASCAIFIGLRCWRVGLKVKVKI